MLKQYSQKEIELFKSFGYEQHLEFTDPPPSLYRIVMENVFINNKTGSNVDSLRRCLNAINDCKPSRMTKEFDNLIQL